MPRQPSRGRAQGVSSAVLTLQESGVYPSRAAWSSITVTGVSRQGVWSRHSGDGPV